MAELQPSDVLQIALQLLEAHRLTERQYMAFHAYRILGLTSREAAAWIGKTYNYEISHMTVMHDSRYAHEIVLQAIENSEEGAVRFGVTVAAGSESWFAPDATAQQAARRIRGVLRAKKKAKFDNFPIMC